MEPDINKKITRIDQAAKAERLSSPQIIQPMKAVRFPDIEVINVHWCSGNTPLAANHFVQIRDGYKENGIWHYNVIHPVINHLGLYWFDGNQLAVLRSNFLWPPNHLCGKAYISGTHAVKRGPSTENFTVGGAVGTNYDDDFGGCATVGGPFRIVEIDTDFVWVNLNGR